MVSDANILLNTLVKFVVVRVLVHLDCLVFQEDKTKGVFVLY